MSFNYTQDMTQLDDDDNDNNNNSNTQDINISESSQESSLSQSSLFNTSNEVVVSSSPLILLSDEDDASVSSVETTGSIVEYPQRDLKTFQRSVRYKDKYLIYQSPHGMVCSSCLELIKQGDKDDSYTRPSVLKCKLNKNIQHHVCSNCITKFNATQPSPAQPDPEEYDTEGFRTQQSEYNYDLRQDSCFYCSASYRWLMYITHKQQDYCQSCTKQFKFSELDIVSGKTNCPLGPVEKSKFPETKEEMDEIAEKMKLITTPSKRFHIFCTECHENIKSSNNENCVACETTPSLGRMGNVLKTLNGESAPRVINGQELIDLWYIKNGHKNAHNFESCENCQGKYCDVKLSNLRPYKYYNKTDKLVLCKECADDVSNGELDVKTIFIKRKSNSSSSSSSSS